ncbi:MAG: hypothetical protein U0132_04715 [Gemmatimonadaceae bacterium]
MNGIRVLRFIALAGVVGACGASCRSAVDGPIGLLPYASATQSCGPADGPAVAILLSANADVTSANPSYPLVRVTIWRSLSDARGKTVQLGGNDGFAAYARSGEDVVGASRGSITLDAGTNAVTGTVDLAFPNRDPVRGRFTAVWLERTILCG